MFLNLMKILSYIFAISVVVIDIFGVMYFIKNIVLQAGLSIGASFIIVAAIILICIPAGFKIAASVVERWT